MRKLIEIVAIIILSVGVVKDISWVLHVAIAYLLLQGMLYRWAVTELEIKLKTVDLTTDLASVLKLLDKVIDRQKEIQDDKKPKQKKYAGISR